MSKQNFSEFLEILESETNKALQIQVSSGKNPIEVKPLSFKQQRTLVTSGVGGIVGVMSFIKNLNEAIIYNSDEKDLKIYDRVPIILALRKELSDKKIIKDGVEVDINDLISQYKPFIFPDNYLVDGNGFQIQLRIPTLTQENRFLSNCIEELKRGDVDDMSKNISLILIYEIPKFLDHVTFGDRKIVFDDLTIGDRTKIIDNLPATVTNKITDFILSIRQYDEESLTYNGVTIDIDYSLFE